MSSKPPTAAAPAAPSKISIIFAGEIFDGSDATHPLIKDHQGTPYEVRVRAMPVRHLQRVLDAITNEHELLMICCQLAIRDAAKPVHVVEWAPVEHEWVENLAEASHLLLLEAAKRQNFTRTIAFGKRKLEAMEAKMPLTLKVDETVKPVVQEMVHLILSSMPPAASSAASPTKS